MDRPSNFVVAMIPAGQGIRRPKRYMQLTPQGVCWHWTANTGRGADARSHLSYWHRAEYGAHYVLDDKEIIQCVPDTEVVWHAGPGSAYTDFIKRRFPRGANSFLIGVEMCVHQGHDWAKTYANAVALGVYLCKKYGWAPENNFFRHYDCTRKDCPRMWTPHVPGGQEAWEQFKRDVAIQLRGEVAAAMFKDIVNHWAKGDIEWLAERGLLAKAENFRPDDKITRAETAALMRRTIEYTIKEVTKQ